MKTEQILNLDYREDENKETIQKVLRKIKPLSKYSDEIVPLEAIEKTIKVITNKYEIAPQWMTMAYHESILGIYSIGVKTTVDHKWLGTVYGMCLYETFAKLAIKMYSEIRSGKIPLKTLSEEQKERQHVVDQIDSQ